MLQTISKFRVNNIKYFKFKHIIHNNGILILCYMSTSKTDFSRCLKNSLKLSKHTYISATTKKSLTMYTHTH